MMAVSLFKGKLWIPKSLRLFQQIRNGFIVLLPESNPENLNQNPLFKSGLPDFDNLTLDNCSMTFGKYILDFEHCVRETENKVVENKEGGIDIFEDVIDRFEESGAQLEATWGLLKTLVMVDRKIIPTEKYMPLHERARSARSLKYRSRYIYNLLKGCDLNKLTEEEQRVISKFRLEGKLNGLELGVEGAELFQQIMIKLAKETNDFGEKYKISLPKYSHTITDGMVTRDFPEDLLKSMSINRSGNELEGPWNVNLKCAEKFLRFCPERRLRWNTWLAQRQVSSVESDPQLNNSTTLEAIRRLRRDMANILGYITYAHMSMETKMAGSVANVQQTLNLLLNKAKELQSSEIESLQEFAEDRGFRGRLELWDVPFWERRQKQELFNWDERNLREYFPYEKVINGLFDICSEMFSLRFEVSKAKTWHKDVKLINIYEQESTRPIAGVYIDPFAREDKTPTGGQVVCIRPSARALGPTMPLAAIIFSFKPPSSKEPCLLDFEGVENVFKKFGHALQQLLSTVNYMEVSGLSFIEWDAVEVVSNVMSLWLNDPEILEKISGHYKTKEPLPITSLDDVRRHLSGYYLSEELYKANLDLELHSSNEFWNKVVKRLWPEHFIFDLDPNDLHPCSMIQSFAGVFGAAYFSHVWARMLAQDVYTSFQSETDKKNVGLRFRDTFLSFGGACHPNEVFRRFQGRDPSPEALLASIGKRQTES
ncbi:uncharacterized protein [Halyomorpha halys]|uniref:uncharacterized protein isoform X1 n=1 Tax=Halyomorpha halys TaxID=286706 RepID=UPI0006D50AC5|nr:probable cytosolic oligopeptidase A [Halyomorpha halys]